MSTAMRNRTIENPVFGNKITFMQRAQDTQGAYSLQRLEVAPGGGNMPHIHTGFTERFDVVAGQLGVHLDGQDYLLEVGDSLVVPPNAVHHFYNATLEPAKCIVEMRPASPGHEDTLRILYGLARDGKVNSKGVPTVNLLQRAVYFQMGASYRPGLPLGLQKVVFGTLATIGKLFGQDKALLKYLAE